MRTIRSLAALLVLALLVSAPLAQSSPVGVVKESGRTAGHAVRDGALTIGRTVRDFFTGGPRKAGETWKQNAAATRDDAQAGKERIKHEAQD